jgi:hypothetical protein
MTDGAFCVIFMVILKKICHLAQIVIACKWSTTCYYFSGNFGEPWRECLRRWQLQVAGKANKRIS